MSLPKHKSSSQIKKYVGCGQAYKKKYADGITEPKSASQVTGSCLHSCAQIDLKDRVVGLRWHTRDELLEHSRKYIDDEFEKDDPIVFDFVRTDFPTKSLIFSWVECLLSKYLEIRENINPALVEYEMTLHIPVFGYTEQDYKIILDLAEQNGNLSDWKCSIINIPNPAVKKKRESSLNQALAKKKKCVHLDFALTGYCMAYYHKYGRMPDRVFYRCLILDADRMTVEYVELDTARDFGHVNKFILYLEEVLKGMSAGAYIPCLDSWMCCPEKCYYYPRCEYVSEI